MRALRFVVPVVSSMLVGSATHATDMGPIVSAETRTGNISLAGQVDTFTFTGQAGESVVIVMTSASGYLLYPHIDLEDPASSVEASAQGTTSAEIHGHELLQSGTYTIAARDWDSIRTDGYYLSLLVIPGATTSAQDGDGGRIESAETKTGTVSTPADTDAFTFHGESGRSVLVHLGREGASLNPLVRIYSPTGVELTSDWDTNTAEIDTYALTSSGTHTLVVKDHQGFNTGSYSLSLLVVAGPTVSVTDADGGAIASGDAKLGALSLNADTDAYSFGAAAGDVVTIGLTDLSGTLYPRLRLLDPAGAQEAEAHDLGTAQIAAHALADGGLYTIVVSGYTGLRVGNYSLTLVKDPVEPVLTCSASATLSQSTAVLRASISGPGGLKSVGWTYGDGSPPSGSSCHVYSEPGTYVWYLIVERAAGGACVAHGTLTVTTAGLFADALESATLQAWSTTSP